MADPVYTRNALDPGPPIMPETYDRPRPVDDFAGVFKAIGAGAVSPFGFSEHMLRSLAPRLSDPHNINARWAADRLYELRSEHPGLAGAGSGAALVPAALLAGATLPELAPFIPPAMALGASSATAGDIVWPAKKPQRPQAAYPPGGAY